MSLCWYVNEDMWHLHVLMHLNSYPPSAAYIRQSNVSALVQIMVCRLFGAKPLSKPMPGFCQMDDSEWRPFCPGGDVLTLGNIGHYNLPGIFVAPEHVPFYRYMKFVSLIKCIQINALRIISQRWLRLPFLSTLRLSCVYVVQWRRSKN